MHEQTCDSPIYISHCPILIVFLFQLLIWITKIRIATPTAIGVSSQSEKTDTVFLTVYSQNILMLQFYETI